MSNLEKQEKIVKDFDFDGRFDDEYYIKVLKFEDGVAEITYDQYGYVKHITVLDREDDIRLEVDRYYDNLNIQLWYRTGDTKIIRVNVEYEFDVPEKPFFEYVDDYERFSSAYGILYHFVDIMRDYLNLNEILYNEEDNE